MAKRTKTFNYANDFPFFDSLRQFYLENKGKIRRNYKDTTRKYLDYNDKNINTKAYLRKPQFEALEMYIFLKEFMENKKVYEIFMLWKERQDMFSERSYYQVDWMKSGQISMYDYEAEKYTDVFNFMKDNSEDYPNYIYALTMGVGKTILMATCIFYEFLLSYKYPKDSRYCHNAIVFAPDKTVRQSLKEIQTFNRNLVVPPEYSSLLNSNIKFHFLDEDSSTLNTIDESDFNLIISNTQKIILKTKRTDFSSFEKLMKTDISNSNNINLDALPQVDPGFNGFNSDNEMITNQRFEKIKRLKQLGIYVDEAHHLFGNELDSSMRAVESKTSLRKTINEIAKELEIKGTQLVACYNYTGTPYVNNTVLPDVVYYYGLKQAIDEKYLKRVIVEGYDNVKDKQFLNLVLDNFFTAHNNEKYDGLLPKIAIFGSTVDEVINIIKPAVEEALVKLGKSQDTILVNVGDNKYTKDEDINNFNNLDVVGTEGSAKQVILLVGKGKEGWNCRSLFSVALFRKPNSTIFVLQATMRCLRKITETQQQGCVYLSKENFDILDSELSKNFKVSINEISKPNPNKIEVFVKLIPPSKLITISEIKHNYELIEIYPKKPINFKLSEINIDKFRSRVFTNDLTSIQSTREKELRIQQKYYSLFELVFEISSYLNLNPITIEKLVVESLEGTDSLLSLVNQYNSILKEIIIPGIFNYYFKVIYKIESSKKEVELVNFNGRESFMFLVEKDLLIESDRLDLKDFKHKSFNVDKYCFDSKPELELFLQYLKSKDIKEIYFTGMFTGSNNGLSVQYIDPESNVVRNYYPDFLALHENGKFEIIEVKGDTMIDDAIVKAKAYAAIELAEVCKMEYNIYKSSEIMKKGIR